MIEITKDMIDNCKDCSGHPTLTVDTRFQHIGIDMVKYALRMGVEIELTGDLNVKTEALSD